MDSWVLKIEEKAARPLPSLGTQATAGMYTQEAVGVGKGDGQGRLGEGNLTI